MYKFIFEMVGEAAQVMLACPMRWGQCMARGHHNRVGCILFAVRSLGSHLFPFAVTPPLVSVQLITSLLFSDGSNSRSLVHADCTDSEFQLKSSSSSVDKSTAEPAGPGKRGPNLQNTKIFFTGIFRRDSVLVTECSVVDPCYEI
jgi:hypothetical protein